MSRELRAEFTGVINWPTVGESECTREMTCWSGWRKPVKLAKYEKKLERRVNLLFEPDIGNELGGGTNQQLGQWITLRGFLKVT